ncbi:MAG: AraC family transcriptional regulator [Paludibacteraceae bacterium]|nr:AraC family transcriptional regulator [Paludibacteraceae bacterium]
MAKKIDNHLGHDVECISVGDSSMQTNLYNILPLENSQDLQMLDMQALSADGYPPFFRISTTALVFVQKGEAVFDVQFHPVKVQAPALVVLFPQCIMQVNDNFMDFNARIIAFTKNYEDLLHSVLNYHQIRQNLIHHPCISLDETAFATLTLYFDTLQKILSTPSNQPNMYAITINLLRSLQFYLQTLYKDAFLSDAIINRKEEITNLFFDLLEKNVSKEIDIDFFAQKLCISPKYLTNTLKEITKKTATQWINSYILQQAKTMLRTSSMNIQQISNALGFENQSHFGSWFRRQTNGTNPTDFRIIPKK